MEEKGKGLLALGVVVGGFLYLKNKAGTPGGTDSNNHMFFGVAGTDQGGGTAVPMRAGQRHYLFVQLTNTSKYTGTTTPAPYSFKVKLWADNSGTIGPIPDWVGVIPIDMAASAISKLGTYTVDANGGAVANVHSDIELAIDIPLNYQETYTVHAQLYQADGVTPIGAMLTITGPVTWPYIDASIGTLSMVPNSAALIAGTSALVTITIANTSMYHGSTIPAPLTIEVKYQYNTNMPNQTMLLALQTQVITIPAGQVATISNGFPIAVNEAHTNYYGGCDVRINTQQYINAVLQPALTILKQINTTGPITSAAVTPGGSISW